MNEMIEKLAKELKVDSDLLEAALMTLCEQERERQSKLDDNGGR